MLKCDKATESLLLQIDYWAARQKTHARWYGDFQLKTINEVREWFDTRIVELAPQSNKQIETFLQEFKYWCAYKKQQGRIHPDGMLFSITQIKGWARQQIYHIMKDQPQVNAVFKHGKRQLVARDEP
jgi:hypothetical protein